DRRSLCISARPALAREAPAGDSELSDPAERGPDATALQKPLVVAREVVGGGPADGSPSGH
ncbi:hypothetical protein E2320_000918, partial [Naja naja]